MFNTIIMRHDGYGEKPVQSTMEDMQSESREVLDHIITNEMSGIWMEFPNKHRNRGKVFAREALSYYAHDPVVDNNSRTLNFGGGFDFSRNTMLTIFNNDTWPVFRKYIKTKDPVILYSNDYENIIAQRNHRLFVIDIFEIPNLIIYAKNLT